MKNARQVLWGIIIALVSIIFILGGVTLSLAEGNALARTPTLPSTASPTLWIPVIQPVTPTEPPLLPMFTSTVPTITVPPSLTPLPPSTTITITQPPNTSTPTVTRTASKSVTAPPPATPTMTATACGAPANWGTYVVKPGDTLYGLSLKFGATVSALQRANCLGESTLLKVGQKLRVPPATSVPPTVSVPTSIPSSPTQTPFTPLPTSLP